MTVPLVELFSCGAQSYGVPCRRRRSSLPGIGVAGTFLLAPLPRLGRGRATG